MLGISAGLEYTQLNDFKSSKDYINYMYHDIQGLFARVQMKGNAFIQSMKRRNGLLQEKFDDMTNLFVSMNSFYLNKRTVECVKRLNACYVDIDCYKLNLRKETVLFELENEYFGIKIPVPTFVIDSGNGLYLIWKLRNEDRNALPRWKKVQTYLCETLKELGADSACTDAARILRVPFSINEKNRNTVKIIDFNDLTFSLYDIANEFDINLISGFKRNNKSSYPYGTATQKMRNYSTKIAETIDIKIPDFNNYKETFNFIKKYKKTYEKKTLNKRPGCGYKNILMARCHDIEKLYSMRQGVNCKREIGLFLYRHWLYECTKNSNYALNKTLELNKRLDQPFDTEYVIKRTSSAEKKIQKYGQIYNYSNKTIIEILEITESEMKSLSVISNKKESKVSRKEKNKKSYLNRLLKNGEKTKQTKIQERQEMIENLLKNGKNRVEICALLHISKATYQRDLIVIKERQKEYEVVAETASKKEKKQIMTVRAWVAKTQKWGVSFFNTLYYICSVATARVRVRAPSICKFVFIFDSS